MESYLLDWSNLLLRWVHVITAIAWVGSSFYFVFLDNNLVRPTSPDLLEKGVDGALWAVHGGGFYNPQKYLGAPKKIHTHLHWFYWESYSTWLSGFALFTVTYLWSASTYLIDKSLMDWSPGAAVGVAVSFLVVFWMVYDLICQAFGFRKNGDAIVGVLVFLVVCLASWLACQWFAGRAAFLLIGAMIATAMSANVFFWIIPGQRKVVAAMNAGLPADPVHGRRGKQRSVHNTYFTLPVLFAMLSNHYSFTYTHPQNWLVLVLMMLAGAMVRQYFVMRHGYKLGRNGNPLPYALVGTAVIAGVIVWLRPPPQAAAVSAPEPSGYAQVRAVLEQRCVMCHGVQVQMKNVRLDSADALKLHAQGVYQQAVVARTMPMNNATGLTDAERLLIGRWFLAGAKTE
ncbi:MAG: urate hydroxylase PuuD [Burkholderiaceae bacterium]|nr:urate hydroxylase PuuD [Burkholderiaceae bacterium]MDP1968529.1 urate hydroxylase PuuD [Burkholderiaceae bacterium]